MNLLLGFWCLFLLGLHEAAAIAGRCLERCIRWFDRFRTPVLWIALDGGRPGMPVLILPASLNSITAAQRRFRQTWGQEPDRLSMTQGDWTKLRKHLFPTQFDRYSQPAIFWGLSLSLADGGSPGLHHEIHCSLRCDEWSLRPDSSREFRYEIVEDSVGSEQSEESAGDGPSSQPAVIPPLLTPVTISELRPREGRVINLD